MDFIKKLLAFIGLIIYITLICFYCINTHFKWYFYLLLLYPTVRILIDICLFLYALFDNEQALLFIEKISHQKVKKEIIWNKRLLGISKWVLIHCFVLMALLIIKDNL